MITPRRTRLIRVPDLHASRHVVTALSLAGAPARIASRAVLVPTRGAARQLRRTLGNAPAVPALLTRDEFYDALHTRLADPPRQLSAYERDVIVQAAARVTAIEDFRLRPGLVVEVLRFYDQLRRQARNITRFEELLEETLSKDAEYDRGAARMLAQTKFLVATFRAYEQRLAALHVCDEHSLRERALAETPADPIRDVVVTLGDWIAEPNGLYLADFDLLSRLGGLEAIDIVATERLLGSGFHQRIHEWLPGIEEVDAAAVGASVPPPVRPTLGTPPGDTGRLVFVHRDREEELIAIARRIKTEAVDADRLDRHAVVFKRPLPYLYLAAEVFGGAGIPYQTFDALPLAAEPFAAALDLVFEFVESGFTRGTLVALLRSPHFLFGETALDGDAISRLDRELSESRYLGGLERLTALAASRPRNPDDGAGAALKVASAAAARLAPLLDPGPASSQCRVLIEFLDAHACPIADEDPQAPRRRRARAAVCNTLDALAAAHEAHDEAAMRIADVSASTRRWIGEQTFLPEPLDTGVQLIDDQAARFGDFDDMAVVGLVEGEWPDRARRNIFYPSSLLASLGWPSEKDRRSAAESRFLDLLGAASRRVTASTITLDEDALVEVSAFADEIARARLSTVALDPPASSPISTEEALALDPPDLNSLDLVARSWAQMRAARSSGEDPAYHGQTGAPAARAWSVSALETYQGCPFKFFARYILRLDEEPEDEEVMTPLTQGVFMHDVFEAFFAQWQTDGHQAITPANLDVARAVFRDVAEERLARLSDTDAALERTRLLGSPVAAGLGEAVLRMEAERPVPVVARLLERRLDGEFTFDTPDGPRTVALRGKADRIDLLADGTFRLLDYKLGWPPGRDALQLPVYGMCAEQQLDGYRGRRWTLGEAAYLAFKGPKRVSPLFTAREDRQETLAKAAARLVETVDAIGRGEFPPTPDDVFRCETCSYAAVCRKDYVGDV